MIYRLCDTHSNVQVMITGLIWITLTSVSAARERTINVITHSLTIYPILAMPRVETRGSQNKITVLNIIVLRKRLWIWLATTREQSVIVTSQLLATGSCIDDVTIGQHFESFRAVTG